MTHRAPRAHRAYTVRILRDLAVSSLLATTLGWVAIHGTPPLARLPLAVLPIGVGGDGAAPVRIVAR